MLIFRELMFLLLHFGRYSDKVRVIKLSVFKNIEERGLISMGNNENEYFDEDEELFVTLDLEDEGEVECQVLTIFEAEGQDYIVLLPTDIEDDEEGEVYIYRYFEDEDGEPGLDNIETEEEFEMVSAVFDQLVEDGEYDEIIEDEDEE